ncbi:MAG: response regulator [Nitrospirota bacterium]
MDAAERAKRYVLVVETNVDDRFTVSMLLQRFGCTICSAHSAEEAMEFLTVAPPAAVVSEDGQLGTGLLARIKKDGRFSDVPVILLTASPDHALEDRARRGEIAAVLRKPVDAEAFYRAIQASVEKTPRKNIRVVTYLPAKLANDPAGGDGYVTVLSEYGMFFRTLEPREVHAKVPVDITVKGRSIPVEAVVLYTCEFDEGPFKEPGMGMKFSKISDDARALIRDFILEQIGAGTGNRGT